MERSNTRILVLSLLLAFLSGAEAQESGEILTYLRPYRTFEIHAPERGTVKEILVEKGDTVQEGEVLLTLDSDLIEARLAIARANAENIGTIQAAEADVTLNRDRLEIVEKLRERGTTNTAEYERQKAQLAMSEANLIATEEEKKIAELQAALIETELERRRLRSPGKGVVVEISADEGESVAPTTSPQEPVLRLVEIDRLRAKAFIPYRRASKLKTGDSVKIQFGESGRNAVGIIEFRSPVADPATGTIEIIAVFENAANELPIGVQSTLSID